MRTKQENDVLIAKFKNDVNKRSWVMRLLLVLDQFGNVLLLNGSQDETISSHIGRTGKAKWLCWLLRKLESKHCLKSRGE